MLTKIAEHGEKKHSFSNPKIHFFLNYCYLLSPYAGAEGTVPKYTYKHADIRPWDVRNDLIQYERDYVICTKTRLVVTSVSDPHLLYADRDTYPDPAF
jgi:hypothetical protein